jgi:hypothetical protein
VGLTAATAAAAAAIELPSRYYVHVAAEAWGLGHASHNEGEERVIKVNDVMSVT